MLQSAQRLTKVNARIPIELRQGFPDADMESITEYIVRCIAEEQARRARRDGELPKAVVKRAEARKREAVARLELAEARAANAKATALRREAKAKAAAAKVS